MILSSLLLILAFPPFDFGWLGLAALIPWLEAIDRSSSPRQAWRQGYRLGVLFFAGTIWWLVHVTVFGLIVLVAYTALYFAAFGLITKGLLLRSKPTVLFPFVLASVWTILEWIRGTLGTGFGWNLIGYTQWKTPILQWAELLGVWGVSWLVVLVNATLWLAWKKRSRKMALAVAAGCIVILGAGLARQFQIAHLMKQGPAIRVGLVQGNVPQDQKWDADYYNLIVNRYSSLTRKLASKKLDLIIWPETATPNLANDPSLQSWLAGLSRDVGAPLLVGAPRAEWVPQMKLYNSAIFVTPQGDVSQQYDKMHLVPFGEFIPGEEWLPAIGRVRNLLPIGEFSPGSRPTVFQVKSKTPFSLSTLICFEDVFPQISRNFIQRGARMLVTITNDAWFGDTAAPIQHAQTSVFRAVENRVPMVRAANTGYSCAIDPAGRVTAEVKDRQGRKIGITGVAVAPVSLIHLGPTLYTRWGDGWLVVCMFLAGTGAGSFVRKTKSLN
ncbi:MAG: apolipoprotein N-acyltransferase [Candidatus Omnitrophica bacterium]|nr:apolipoprotein N-acyltransferase [Candidatus Omnitrophota bacterium]